MKNNHGFSVIIPARMNSSRLPRKMLADLGGIPLIVRVANQAKLSNAQRVIVATDHQEIMACCQQHNIEVLLTSPDHQSGTDRIAEVVRLLGLQDDEIIINVQGDEPLINPDLINRLAEFIQLKQAAIATIAHPIHQLSEVSNPNIVKTVVDHESFALYFSRAMIPYYRDGYNNHENQMLPAKLAVLRHIGIYAYSAKFLREFQQLTACPLEETEALEQLRALYYGYKIAVLTSEYAPAAGVDTFDDLIRVRQILANLGAQ